MLSQLLYFRRASAAAVAILTAGAAISSAQAQVDLHLRFDTLVQSFSPLEPPVYILFVGVSATGFTDEMNADNHIHFEAASGAYYCDAYPGLGTGSSSSAGSSSAADLSDNIQNAGNWYLAITDGATGITSNYLVNVSTPGIPPEFLRPISLLNAPPDSIISHDPTFEFSLDPTDNSEADYTVAYADMYGQLPGNFIYTPPLLPTDTSWTPDGPLQSDTYGMTLSMRNDSGGGQWLVVADFPEPLDGAPPLGNFDQSVGITSIAQTYGLICSANPYAVDVSFSPDVISFSPGAPPIYILGIAMNASGFTDESNLDNYVRLQSAQNEFSGDWYPARGSGSGTAGSEGVYSALDLSDAINASNPWTLTVIDGVTGATSLYSMNITTPGIAPDFVRPITLDTPPGSSISSNPTFGFTLDPTATPEAQYTSAFAFLLGQLPGNFYGLPPISPSDTSWTPDGPILPDTYTVVVGMQNIFTSAVLIETTSPVALDPSFGPVNFTFATSCATFAQSEGLISAPYCPADFNQDGGIDGSDVSAFFAEWEAGNSTADVNQDGGVDGADVGAFFAAWENGGC